jgi:hypothetical protein
MADKNDAPPDRLQKCLETFDVAPNAAQRIRCRDHPQTVP